MVILKTPEDNISRSAEVLYNAQHRNTKHRDIVVSRFHGLESELTVFQIAKMDGP